MPRHDDEQFDGLDESEFPDESDMDDSEESDTLACPKCRCQVHERTDICPYCGQYIMPDQQPRGVPGWLMLAVMVLVILGMLWFAFH